jgi:hypothetical protein
LRRRKSGEEETSMIAFVRSYSIMPGKTPDAVAVAHKIKKHAKENHGFEINLIMPIGGNPNRIAFVSTAPSLAEFEGNLDKMAADAEWQKLIAGNAGNVVPGSVHDEIWRYL